MTISNENRVVRHIGNGVTTVFPYTFLIPEGRAVVSVYDTLTGVQTTLSEPAYSITGEDDVNGGTVTYNPGGVPIPNTKWLIIERVMPYTQSLSITNQAGFFPDLLEQQLDRTTMQIQQISEELNRAIVVLPGETPPNATQLVATLNASQTAAAASATAAASSASAATAARDAALSAVPNAFPLTRTAMLALNTSTHTVAYLLEAGRRGQFVWDGSDLSGTLLGASRTSTGVNTGTDVVTDNNHGYETGFAVVVTGTAPGGLANNTLYYVIKVDDNSYKLATTFANAIAGVAFDITASPAGQVTSRRHFDPRQGVYVTPTSNITGAAGAWVRQFDGPIRPEWFGATLVANSQEALQGFFGYPHTDLFLPAGEWRSDGTLYRKTDINLRASGALDFSNSSGQLIIKGSITALAALAANVAKFARVLTFPAGQTIAAGDVIILHNPTNYSFGADRAE
ncbi:MAG TPA: hypothetical protein VHK27_02970, partial [Gammaproteobacteria bacterium]|nr:hypothetical protein [Gammaproteobacteria bacterium]